MKQQFEDYITRSREIRSLSMPPEETEAHIGEIYRLFNENFARALANTRTLEMVDVQLAWLILRDLYYYYKKQYEENSDESVLEEYIFCIFKVVTVGYNVIQGSDKGRANTLIKATITRSSIRSSPAPTASMRQPIPSDAPTAPAKILQTCSPISATTQAACSTRISYSSLTANSSSSRSKP